jgi:Ni/Fe-hydrogenase subunit HybB-like protein
MREIRVEWIKGASLVLLGLLAAILLLKKKRSGRILAVALASALLLLKAFYFVKYWHYKMSPEYWEINFRTFPAHTIQSIVAAIVMIMTLILMLRPHHDEPNNRVHSDAPEGGA